MDKGNPASGNSWETVIGPKKEMPVKRFLLVPSSNTNVGAVLLKEPFLLVNFWKRHFGKRYII